MTGDPTAVLRRELSRTSRQRLTYAVRLVFVVGVMGGLLLRFGSADFGGPGLTEQASAARRVFEDGATIVILAMGVAAPAMVATAFVDEREQRTLDLLRLTQLRPWAVVLGAFGARAVGVAGLLVATLPALSMILPYGGVAVADIAGVGVRAALVGVLLGILAGYLSLTSRSMLGPLAGAFGFGFFGMFLVPVLVAELGLDSASDAQFTSPWMTGDEPGAWLTLLALWTPAAALGIGMTVARYRFSVLGDGDDPTAQAERRRWAWWGSGVSAALLAAIGLTVAVPVGRIVFDHPAVMSQVGWFPVGVLVWPTACLGFAALYLWFLQLGGEIVDRFGDGLPVHELTGVRLPRGVVLTWPEASWLIGSPVVVRELTTRALGGVGWLAVVVFGLFGFFAFTLWGIGEFEFRPRQVRVVGALGAALVAGFGVAALTQSVTDERRAGTFPLLLTTPYAPWRVVVGKGLAVAVRFGLPALAIAALGATRFVDDGDPALVVVSTLALGTWWVALGALTIAVALGTRPAWMSWAINLALPFAAVVLAMLADSVDFDLGVALTFPFVLDREDHTLPLALASVLHAAMALGAGLASTRLLRRVAAHEGV